MTIRLLFVCMLVGLYPSWVLADDAAPGLWELSLEATVDAVPGFNPPPFTINQCLTKADARDPGKLLEAVASPGAGDCTYTERNYVGDRFRFKMQCAGTFQMHSMGEVSVSATVIDGSITTSSTIEGQSVTFKSVIHGRRLGDC